MKRLFMVAMVGLLSVAVSPVGYVYAADEKKAEEKAEKKEMKAEKKAEKKAAKAEKKMEKKDAAANPCAAKAEKK